MSDTAFSITILVALVLWVLLSVLWRRFHPARPRGRSSVEAAQWAELRFPTEVHTVAAILADLVHEQLGISFAQLAPQTRFLEDLSMDEYEAKEFAMALEEELGCNIPPEDAKALLTVIDLIDYLSSMRPS